MRLFSQVVDVALPLEGDVGVFFHGEHPLDLRKMRSEEVGQGLGTVPKREEHVDG